MASRPPDVLVLGAGAAGLAAAEALRRAGRSALVVEARDRPGGRVDTRRDPVHGVPVERGAEFVHGRAPEVESLAAAAGVRLRRVPDRHLVAGPSRRGGDGDLRALEAGEDLLAGPERDGETVAARLGRLRRAGRASAGGVRMARAFVEGFYLADPRTASAAAIARLERGMAAIGAEATYRAEGGWSALLAPLVAPLVRGGALRLGTRAVEVRWRPGAVEVAVRGPAGAPLPSLHAARAIVTLPVGVLRAGAVRFAPALPGKARAWSALEMGPVVKVILRFRAPPWRARGSPLRGLGFLHLPGAPVPVFWTLAPLAAPHLVGWAGGPRAARLAGRSPQAVLAAALGGLAPALGGGRAALEEALDGAEVVSWADDPLARGGYAVFPAGAEGAAAQLAAPVADTLFFAGEATDPALAGTVAGALRSGRRAARELLATW